MSVGEAATIIAEDRRTVAHFPERLAKLVAGSLPPRKRKKKAVSQTKRHIDHMDSRVMKDLEPVLAVHNRDQILTEVVGVWLSHYGAIGAVFADVQLIAPSLRITYGAKKNLKVECIHERATTREYEISFDIDAGMRSAIKLLFIWYPILTRAEHL